MGVGKENEKKNKIIHVPDNRMELNSVGKSYIASYIKESMYEI